MGKKAGETVQALLARAPAPPGAPVPPRTQQPALSSPAAVSDQVDKHTHQAEASGEPAEPVAATPVIAARSRRRREPVSAEQSPPAEPTAPPTLRLSQPTAEALRAAWLTEKRDRVLLTYQDFAGEIIAAGLRQKHLNKDS